MMAASDSILLVGSQPLQLAAVESLLERGGFTIVGRVSSAKEALALLQKQPADVLLVDLGLGEEAIALLRKAREHHNETAVVMLAERGDEARIGSALAEGAAACVLNSGDPDDLLTAVRQARRRSVFLAATAVDSLRGDAVAGGQLSAREIEILRLVATGASNSQIASQLWLTEHTVKFHLSKIYRKFGVSNRTEASRYAVRHGLLSPTTHASRRSG
jgi:DNA-binding NarL/FixJ family response regulator